MFSFSKSLAALGGLLLAFMVFVNLAAVDSAAQDPKKTQLEGVWKVAEVVPPASSPDAKPTPITSPQPGLLIFTKGYYSGMAVTASQPRTAAAPPKDPRNLTDAEKIALYDQWVPFIANAGTYEVKGSTLTLHVMVAKNPGMMTTESTVTWEFKLEGNTFWLIPPADRATTAARVKFTRLE